jgi:hypothetical protein
MIRQRVLVRLAVGVLACGALFACGALWRAEAEAPACQYFKVRANTANVSKEPRADSIFIDLLDKGDIVCVTRNQKVADTDLAYIPHKLSAPGKHTTVEGWVDRAFSSRCHPLRSPRRLVKLHRNLPDRHRNLPNLGQAEIRVRVHHPLRLRPRDRRTKSRAIRSRSRPGRTQWLATLSNNLRRESRCFRRSKDSTRANGKRTARIATNGIARRCARKA